MMITPLQVWMVVSLCIHATLTELACAMRASFGTCLTQMPQNNIYCPKTFVSNFRGGGVSSEDDTQVNVEPHRAKLKVTDCERGQGRKSNQQSSVDVWLSTFQTEIREIRLEMEREAKQELNRVKDEILALREEQKKRREKEEVEMKKKDDEKAKDDKDDEWEKVADKIILEANVDCSHEIEDTSTGVDSPSPDKIVNLNQNELDDVSIKSDLLVVGDTDEGEEDVVQKLETGLMKERGNVADKISEEFEREHADLKVTSAKQKIKSKKKKAAKEVLKKSASKGKGKGKMPSLSNPPLSNKSFNLTRTKEKDVNEALVRIQQKFVRYSVLAIIITIAFSLVYHSLFADGGLLGIGAELLQKGHK